MGKWTQKAADKATDAVLGKGHTGGPDRDLRDETTKQGKEKK